MSRHSQYMTNTSLFDGWRWWRSYRVGCANRILIT
jgi:hypothetical protein